MRRFDIKSIRDDFPILAREVYGRKLVYADNAATAQKPLRVISAVDELYTRYNGNVHRGAHRLSDESTAAYEAARDTVRDFIGARHREEIIFTSGATASLNIAAYGLCGLLVGSGDNVIVSEMEHHSNIVPWQLAAGAPAGDNAGETSLRGVEIRVLPLTDEGVLRLDLLENLIDGRTRVIAITQCSNVLGTQNDIARVSEIAHRHGIVVVVDGCQGVVHGKVDVAAMDCDLYAFSGHKLYAPTGIGVLYGKKEILEKMPPVLGGGDMVKTVTFAKTTYAELPFKFEAGTTNYAGAIGLAEAVRYLAEFDPREIERHEQGLLDAATAELSRIEGLRIYGTAENKAPIMSFTIESVHPSDVGMILDKQGIAVRTGTHCAQPLMARFGTSSMCRASFAMYNTEDEVGALVEATRKAVEMLRR